MKAHSENHEEIKRSETWGAVRTFIEIIANIKSSSTLKLNLSRKQKLDSITFDKNSGRCQILQKIDKKNWFYF